MSSPLGYRKMQEIKSAASVSECGNLQTLSEVPLIECVPNFSEGRDLSKIQEISAAIASAGPAVLRTESDADHNRSVVTLVGSPDAVVEGAFRAIAAAKSRIDLRQHRGVHPRIGAADVVPFVPLRDITIEECARIAHHVGQRVWSDLQIPVYFYESAALRPSCARLENVRKGQFEAPELTPDLGGPELHCSAGASVVGARKLLVAFNVNLDTSDLTVAQRIACKIRASSGGLPFVKALGVPLVSRRIAQVSMNLTNWEVTSPQTAFEAVQSEATAEGVSILSTQLIGLIPKLAVISGGSAFRICEDFGDHRILENRLNKEFQLTWE